MIGSIIGSYRVTEKIGEGGMGAVFKGIDTMLEREVAIKMLKPELASQPDVVERFRSEAVTLAKLNHPNIATLYSFLRQNEDYFMVMEFVRGQTLDDVIKKFGAIDCNRAIVLLCQALEGIDHAHRMGIVHRDIKPANIMLTDSGSIKVMDFGIARVLGSARLTRQGNIVGTVEYMAPEQVRGLAADARSDIYSLGILLYEMLTGRVPFESDSEFELMRAQVEDAPKPPKTFASSIPLAVEQAIMRALAKKPEARPQTAAELRTALLSSVGASTSRIGAPTPYAAPKTQVLESPFGNATGETSAKRTTLPEDTSPATLAFEASRARAHSTGDQSRETQASQDSSSTNSSVAAAGATKAPMSLFARFNWKHYVAAAVVLIAAITAVPFALHSSKGADPPPEPAATEETAAPTESSVPAPPADQTAAPSETPGALDALPANDPARADRSISASNANVDKPARSRANRNDQSSQAPEAAVTPPIVPVIPPVSPPPSPATQPVDDAKKDQGSAPAENMNKNQSTQEKKKGIGGFFKKVFGGSDKKNENENKNKNKRK
jgi:serine/threonine protein kinase